MDHSMPLSMDHSRGLGSRGLGAGPGPAATVTARSCPPHSGTLAYWHVAKTHHHSPLLLPPHHPATWPPDPVLLQEYIDHINEIVRWLGWAPYKVSALFCRPALTGHASLLAWPLSRLCLPCPLAVGLSPECLFLFDVPFVPAFFPDAARSRIPATTLTSCTTLRYA